MTEWLDDFLLRAVIAGLIMVTIAAPMGCLMVWQRLAFLSDTLGHAAVLGVGLGLMLQVKPIFGVLAVALVIVFSLSRVNSFNNALSETTLAIISHTGLAGGIILVGLLPAPTVNLEAILFGDLLATTSGDLLNLLLTTIFLLLILWRHWRAFVAVSVSREIAQAGHGCVADCRDAGDTDHERAPVQPQPRANGIHQRALRTGCARRWYQQFIPVRLANRPGHRRQRHGLATANACGYADRKVTAGMMR